MVRNRTGTRGFYADFTSSALRTEWFRSRERYKRWEEQLVLLKREMTMTIRTFRKRQEVWDWKASTRCPTPGMRVYGLRQSRFYGELAERASQAFQQNIQVSKPQCFIKFICSEQKYTIGQHCHPQVGRTLVSEQHQQSFNTTHHEGHCYQFLTTQERKIR
jgi:hypothetical protein